MNIKIKDISEKDIVTDALILPFFEDYQHEMYSEIDSLLDGMKEGHLFYGVYR